MPNPTDYHDALAEAVRESGARVLDVDQTKDGILILELAGPGDLNRIVKHFNATARNADGYRLTRTRINGHPVIFRAPLPLFEGGRS